MLIVVCTYNEIESLPKLIDCLLKGLPGGHLLVVDDDSPDGTGAWASDRANNLAGLFALVRKNDRGLGAATMAGLKWGLNRNYRLIATMDADFSHDPAQMPKLIEAVSVQQSDVVIGSRYVRGGSIIGWPVTRRIASLFVNGLARWILGLKPRDCTGAMRVYRSEVLDQQLLDSVRCTGYGYLQEILYQLQRRNRKIVEVPICFRDRSAGQSKASVNELVNVVATMLRIRINSHR